MCACVFLFAHSFPCQTNKNIKISGRVRKWDCRVPMPFSPPRLGAGARSTARIDLHMHTTDTQKWSPPSLSSCVCLCVEVSGDDKQKTKLSVPRIYS